jgi:hypothetical protein
MPTGTRTLPASTNRSIELPPEAVRRIAAGNKLHISQITEVRLLDPCFYG